MTLRPESLRYRNRAPCDGLFWSADEVPLAPGERFVDRDKVSAGNLLDELGLADPLFVSAAFVLGHDGERVHLVRKTADETKFRNEMDEGEKGSAPRLDEHDAAAGSKHTLHFREGLV